MTTRYYVKSNLATRPEIVAKLTYLGIVTDVWTDGTFNFCPSSNESEDEFRDILESFDVECELL